MQRAIRKIRFSGFIGTDLQRQSVTQDGIDVELLRKQAQVWTDLVTKEFSDFYDEYQEELER